VNLLNVYPDLRKFLRSPWWPDRINYGFTATAFALIVAVLFIGPQTRDRNFVLNLFWAWWWAFFLFLFSFSRSRVVRCLSLHDLWGNYAKALFMVVSSTT
jgi:polyferredoxin